MKHKVRLIGRSRFFTGSFRKLMEECGYKVQLSQKGAAGSRWAGSPPAIPIVELTSKADLATLLKKKSTEPFLLFAPEPPPKKTLASLKKTGLMGVITRQTSSEAISSLINEVHFHNKPTARNPRGQVSLPVILNQGDKTLRSVASNISRDGIFILTLNPLPAESECDLEFKIPGKRKLFRTGGRVLYSIAINKDLNIIARPQDPFKRLITHPGMAILFTTLPLPDREIINQYVLGQTI